MTSVSVVIPTRNRKDNLYQALASIEAQTLLPQEVIVVDSSDELLDVSALTDSFPKIKIKYLTTTPSVCLQRNTGIRSATSTYVSLCDDDLELAPNYLQEIMTFAMENPQIGAISGLCMQQEDDEWVAKYDVSKYSKLLQAFLLQTSIWGEITVTGNNLISKKIIQLIKKFYDIRSNTHTLAGWPLITKHDNPFYRTQFYGMGGAVIKKEWLLNSPFDENLDAHGIGDNYGVALGFPDKQAIHILSSTYFLHHRAPHNRLKISQAYGKRLLALHYFITTSKAYGQSTKLWFFWSVFGNLLIQIILRNSEMRSESSRTVKKIILGKNPYLIRYKEKLNQY